MRNSLSFIISFSFILYFAQQNQQVKDIEAVVISYQDKSDPKALEIIKKITNNFKQNSPNSLESYSFKSYQKISIDFDADSIGIFSRSFNKNRDSLSALTNRKFNQSAKKKADSLQEIQFGNIFKESQMFLWEKASEYRFSKVYGEKIVILDNKISGLQSPVYEILAINSNINRLPKQVNYENRDQYQYFLYEPTTIEGRETLVIKYREARGIKTEYKKVGFIYVDAQSFALVRLDAESKEPNQFQVSSVWKPINNKWFLQSEVIRKRIGDFELEDAAPKKNNNTSKEGAIRKNRYGNYFILKNNFFDFKTPEIFTARDFKGYSLEVKHSDGTLMEQYRTDSLTNREKNTYEKIDSIGKAFKIDRKINLYSSLLKGNLRLGIFDLDLLKILNFNGYENFRLGMGIKINEKWNKHLSPDLYFAYGTKDRKLKYGLGLDIKTNLYRSSFFRIEYIKDVRPSGGINKQFWNIPMTLNNMSLDFKNDNFYYLERFKISYETDINKGLSIHMALKKSIEKNLLFQSTENEKINNTSAQISFKYAPNSKSMMTTGGKYTYENHSPNIFLNYEKAIKILGGDLNFDKIELLFDHQFKTSFGQTRSSLRSGLLIGNTPIWNAFEVGGLAKNRQGNLELGVSSYLGFATMESGKYYHDRFITGIINQGLPLKFKTLGKSYSSLNLVYKATIGDYKNNHRFRTGAHQLNYVYQEAGVEWNKFLGTLLNLGVHYKLGFYTKPKFQDNLAVQFNFRFNF